MVKIKLAIAILLVIASTAVAQDLSVEVIKVRTVSTVHQVKTVTTFDELGVEISTIPTAGPKSDPIEQTTQILSVKSQASRITVAASDQARLPLPVKDLGGGKYAIGGSWSTAWVTVKAVDFRREIFEEEEVVFKPLAPPEPVPDDTVDNAYGLGRVASTCPIHRDKVAKCFSDAGNFLFGIPSLKAVLDSKEPSGNDPNRNVLKWISVELESYPCSDPESCKRFAAWRKSLNEAILESQHNRQYTRQDWFNAFNEISKAVQK